MPNENWPDQEIVDWLKARGQTEAEIGLVLERLRIYDHLTSVDALMNAIDLGEIDIEKIVREARGAES